MIMINLKKGYSKDENESEKENAMASWWNELFWAKERDEVKFDVGRVFNIANIISLL